jgi:GAF domain
MRAFDYSTFTRAVAESNGQPVAAFKALCEMTRAVVGAKLFTISAHDPERNRSMRVYSNMPDAYPISGTKPVVETDWTRQVLVERQTFVANDIEGIAAQFSDHELIKSLGCESVINVPIVVGGDVLGTINCLHRAGFYTQEKVDASEVVKLPGAVCLLLNRLHAGGGV